MAALGEIARAAADNPQWRYPSGVAVFDNLIYNGPTKIRTQLQEWGLRIFGDNEGGSGFRRLDVIFKGISSTDSPEYIMREVQRRLHGAVTKPAPKKPAQTYVTFASLGPGTPPLPVIPKGNNGTGGNNGSTPLGPYRQKKP